MDIYLVRHGEAAESWQRANDPGLSELGHQQAAQAARALLPSIGDKTGLISSPLKRAQETAIPLASQLTLPVAIDEAFREIPSPVPFDERQGWLQQFMRQQWNEQPQSLLDWREKTLGGLLNLKQPTVVFTHFLVLNVIVGKLTGQEATVCFLPDSASITHVRKEDGGLVLVSRGRGLKTAVN